MKHIPFNTWVDCHIDSVSDLKWFIWQITWVIYLTDHLSDLSHRALKWFIWQITWVINLTDHLRDLSRQIPLSDLPTVKNPNRHIICIFFYQSHNSSIHILFIAYTLMVFISTLGICIFKYKCKKMWKWSNFKVYLKCFKLLSLIQMLHKTGAPHKKDISPAEIWEKT